MASGPQGSTLSNAGGPPAQYYLPEITNSVQL